MDHVLDEILEDLDPEHVPPQFIISARFTDVRGVERVVSGDEFAAILREDRNMISEVRVMLDVKKIRQAVIDEVSGMFERINAILIDSIPDDFEPGDPD